MQNLSHAICRMMVLGTLAVAASAGQALGDQPSPQYPEMSVQHFQTQVGSVVYFAHDRYSLDAKARETLDRQAVWLKRYPEFRLLLVGHTDEHGTVEYSLPVGEKRAMSVKRYLVSQGIENGRIDIRSAGKSQPIDSGHNSAAWAKNRRVETILIEPKKVEQ